MKRSTAEAHPNIALIKYWGKRDVALNLPANGSISITLDQLRTRTTVTADARLVEDQFRLNGRESAADATRALACVERLRVLAGVTTRVTIDSENNFPTAAGLASSASGFAALVTAASAAFGLKLDATMRSVQARLGSGSAARSVFGGFVEMHCGQQPDGMDAHARPLLAADAWPLRVVIAITTRQRKLHGSTEGMERSRLSSPYHPAWVASTGADLQAARTAIETRDFEALAQVSEHSCLKMHADMLASRPPLIYWNEATVAGLHCVRALRREGLAVFFTIDAGPQLKAVCEPDAEAAVREALAGLAGVESVVSVGLGGPARLT